MAMRFFALWILLVCAPAVFARHVLVISIDGLRPDALMQAQAPVVKALIPRGAATLKARTTMPSKTLPSHTSMLTGVGPAKHGITWNDWKPQNGIVKVPTMFELARKAGRSTAMFVGKEKFQHLQRPDSLDVFSIPAEDAKTVSARAADYLVEHKPDLLFVHLADPDVTGHWRGWMSNAQLAAIARADAAVATLLAALDRAGLREDTAVIVTADHGGHLLTHGSNSPEDMTIPWIAVGSGVKQGHTISGAVTTYDTAATALQLLGVAIPAQFDGRPVNDALAR